MGEGAGSTLLFMLSLGKPFFKAGAFTPFDTHQTLQQLKLEP